MCSITDPLSSLPLYESGILDLGDTGFIYNCYSDGANPNTVHFFIAREASGDDMDVEEQDDSDENGRVPDFSTSLARCIDILGSMGSAKTTRTEHFFWVHTDIPDHPNASMLVICCRKSMCFAMTERLKKLGFELYTENMNAKRLVIEYESLFKLERKYDIIYIDEIRSVLATAVCYATNRMNAVRHLDRLVELCTKAKHTILTDADSNLDCAVDIFRDSIFEKKDVHTIRVPKPFMERTYTLMTKDAAYKKMYADLREGKRVVACFASVKMLRGCMEDLKSVIDESLITGYFAAADNKDELFDVNKYWGKYKFIGYTSTVTVSLDFTEPVHRVYSFPNKHAACSREGLQGTARSRNVTTGQIIVAMDSNCQYLPLERGYDFKADYERELGLLAAKRATITSFNKLTETERELYGTFTEELTDEGAVYTPTLFTKLWAVDRAEQALKHRFWYSHFMWMGKWKSYKVEYAIEAATETAADPEDEEERGSGADIEKEVAIKANEIVAQEIEEMDDIDATELGEEWEDLMNKKNSRDMLVHHEKLALRKYKAQKHFTVALTGEDVVFFEKHRRAILYRILDGDATPKQLYSKYMEKVERARRCGMEDIVSQDYNIVTALKKLVRDVGYTDGGVDDMTTEVCLKDVDMTSGGVKVCIDKLKGLGVDGSKSKSLSGLLSNWLMKYMGIKLSRRQISKNNNRVTWHSLKLCPEILAFRKWATQCSMASWGGSGQLGRPELLSLPV